jgi:transcriptional regulator with XRE-family HTH domain
MPEIVSTFCAAAKHKLSFDPYAVDWQLPAMGIGERIAKARRAAGWSQGKLGEKVGAGQTTVSSWERGRTEPTRDDVQRIAVALGFNPAALEFGDESAAPPPTVPLVGYVGAGAQAHYYAAGDGGLGEVDAPHESTAATVAVEVRGDSLGPLFESWLIYYDDVRSPVTSDLFGRLCVVGLPDDRILVKKIKPAALPHHFHLLSNNEEPIFDQEVLWAARVKSMTPR